CAATVLRDGPSLAVLSATGAFERNWERSAPRVQAVGHEKFWPLYGGLFAALARRDTIEPSRTEACVSAVLSDEPSAIDRGSLHSLKLPLIGLVYVLTHAPERWLELRDKAVRQFDTFYSDPDWVPMETGMLALELAALCAIAHDRGFPSNCGSPFVPAWLVAST